MNLGMLSKYNRILHTSTGLSARINVTRGAAAQWCSRRRLISAGIGDSRALGASSRAVSRPFARPTRSSQARCARPDRPQEGFPSTLSNYPSYLHVAWRSDPRVVCLYIAEKLVVVSRSISIASRDLALFLLCVASLAPHPPALPSVVLLCVGRGYPGSVLACARVPCRCAVCFCPHRTVVGICY